MRTAPAAALLLVAVLGLSACAPERGLPTVEPSATPTAVPTTPSEIPGATAAPGSTLADCDALVTPQAMYEFNPNMGLDDKTVPAAGTTAAEVAADGLGCGWLQLSSGETVIVSAARPLGSLSLATSELTATTGFDSPGYFDVVDGVGQAVVVTDDWALVASSTMFTEAGDAAIVVDAAIAALKG